VCPTVRLAALERKLRKMRATAGGLAVGVGPGLDAEYVSAARSGQASNCARNFVSLHKRQKKLSADVVLSVLVAQRRCCSGLPRGCLRAGCEGALSLQRMRGLHRSWIVAVPVHEL
jgi:hypothetical protein